LGFRTEQTAEQSLRQIWRSVNRLSSQIHFQTFTFLVPHCFCDQSHLNHGPEPVSGFVSMWFVSRGRSCYQSDSSKYNHISRKNTTSASQIGNHERDGKRLVPPTSVYLGNRNGDERRLYHIPEFVAQYAVAAVPGHRLLCSEVPGDTLCLCSSLVTGL
jgi:hypothetical protein